VQVGIVAQYKAPVGRVGVFLGNKSSAPIYGISIHAFIKNAADGSQPEGITVQQAPDQDPLPETLMPLGQMRLFFDVACKDVFTTSPTLRITYTLAGAPTVSELQLPVTISHFMDPVTITVSDFFARWKQLGESGIDETQTILNTPFLGTDSTATQWLRNIVGGVGFALINGADPEPDNIVGVGIVTAEAGGRFGCLIRAEPKSSHGLTRLTLRATNADIAKVVASNISMIIESR
ncbi:hypothetical protein GGI12_004529, partial [Dipsacomyces acuminosporus]